MQSVAVLRAKGIQLSVLGARSARRSSLGNQYYRFICLSMCLKRGTVVNNATKPFQIRATFRFIWENIQEKDHINAHIVKKLFIWIAPFVLIWEYILEKNLSNAQNVHHYLPIQTILHDIWLHITMKNPSYVHSVISLFLIFNFCRII